MERERLTPLRKERKVWLAARTLDRDQKQRKTLIWETSKTSVLIGKQPMGTVTKRGRGGEGLSANTNSTYITR